MQFFTGYLIERALSIDNLFVFIVIFAHFRVRKTEQFKVLFWGIIGALVLRAVFIFGGAAIIHRFEWTIFLFGAFLVYTGIRLALEKNKEIEVENNPIIKFLNRHLRTTEKYHGGKYFVKIDGKRFATHLVFALDSIPAIFAVTRDTFIVYSSNIFAVLGLRALYFAVSELVQKFHLLAYGLALILVFVGAKMLLQSVLEVGVAVSLFVVVGVLVAAVVASLLWPAKKGAK
jgi:tellurite resistance protein TerC